MYIEKIDPELRRIVVHASEGFGYLPEDNAYGTLFFQNENGEYPVICGCGGSMWLCSKCKESILEQQKVEV